MPIISHFARELRWRTHLSVNQPSSPLHASTGLRAWLFDSGSLTAKLLKLSDGDFKVQVLRQVHARASRNEALALGIGRHERCLIREVILCGHNQPWVFARSVLPLRSLTGALRLLRKQGTRPLGAFLFSQPHLKRSPIALALISGHHAYLPKALLATNPVWGRRSIFSLEGKPLLVSEVFLPSFLTASACTQNAI